MLLDAPEATIDKRLNILLTVVIALAIAAIIITAIAVPRILSSASDTDAIERGDRIAGCRALFNSRLVGEADTQLRLSSSQLQVATSELLAAAAVGDEEQFEPIGRRIESLLGVVEDRTDALEFGRAEYNALVELSNDDTDAFLAACTRTQEDG